ncbi:MAG: CDC48 family AAA ATPase [Candidatus Nanohaloarchaeota archaeon QJJ-5]|nr:CDC48 family AAA ATPase [Candidatus Nanohaloarchaeota archaeon QJJ-5]
MPDNESTPTDNNSVKLRVGEVPSTLQEDIGSGVVRIDSQVMQKLNIGEGDVIKIHGNRETVAKVARSLPQDAGLGIIRMDGYVRKNAGTSLGEKVTVEPADVTEADRVTLAPAEEGVIIQVSNPNIFKRSLVGRPLSPNDLIVPGSGQQRRRSFFEDMFDMDDFFGNFGFAETKLVVVDTQPDGPVIITENTELDVKQQAVDEAEAGPRVPEVTYEDIGGLDEEIQKVREMIELPLKHPEVFQQLGIDAPSGVLLQGPPGTGKTLIAKAVANEADAYFTDIKGPEVMSKFYGESEKKLREIFEEARDNSPAIIFIDEIDSLAPKRSEGQGEVERRVVSQLLSMMDGLEARENVIVIAATNRPDDIDEALRRPGRFDREIEIGVPDRDGRKEILQIHTRNMPMEDDVDLDGIADNTHGYVGADLEAVCKEAAMTTLRRVLPSIDLDKDEINEEILDELIVSSDDMRNGVRLVEPSAMREIMVETPQVGWDDVGGLDDVQDQLKEMVEWPIDSPDAFDRMGIDVPRGILLYGLPGTGKTLLAKAVANESNANFISIKGPQIFNKFVGESEKAIRKMFSKARQVAPCVLFIDEIDSIAPKRGGHTDSGSTDRVVNQLLTELDGIEDLEGVVVIAATNRPDIIDPAVLRPGRIDRHVYIPVPDLDARKKILDVHTREMPMADDVDLDLLAEKTEQFVGSDIAAMAREAGMNALRKDIESGTVTMEDFENAFQKVSGSAKDRDIEAFREKVESFESSGGHTETEMDYIG